MSERQHEAAQLTHTAEGIVNAAKELRRRKFAIVWLRPGERMPKTPKWTTRSQEPGDYIPGSNLGIMTGWASEYTVCIDLDTQLAIELAPSCLPPTDMVDGRNKKPRSHWWYRVTDIPEDWTSTAEQASAAAIKLGLHPGPKTRGFKLPNRSEILSFRGTGSLATVPPSIVSEELRTWHSFGEPATFPFMELYAKVADLAQRCGWVERSVKHEEASRDLAKVKATDGEGGRPATWHAVKILVNDYAMTAEEAWEHLVEWNANQDPPWSEQELYATMERALNTPSEASFPYGIKALPLIKVSAVRRVETVDGIVDALKYSTMVFRRGCRLVHVIQDDDGGWIIRDAPESVVTEAIASSCRLTVWKQDKNGGEGVERACPVPPWIARTVMERGTWPPIRFLRGIVTTPVLRPDGSLLTEEGYDAASGLLLRPDVQCSIKAEPTLEDAVEALAVLRDVVHQFPWVKGGDYVWVACILTLLARFSFKGPTPLFAFDANAPGVGKTMLAELIHLIVFGRYPTTQSANIGNEEMEKTITAVLMAGTRMTLFDNASGKFGCPAVDRLLTCVIWASRWLGTNTMVYPPNDTVWVVSANNCEYVGDIFRRMLLGKLMTDLERPDARDDLTVKDLCQHVLDHRSEFLSAALTILRAYHHAGRPEVKMERFGKYEHWSRAVRAPIKWAGGEDPIKLRELVRSENNNPFIAVLLGLKGKELSSEGIISLAATDAALKDGLTGLGVDLTRPRSIGNILSRRKDRVVNSMRLRSKSGTGNITLWYVEEVVQPKS